MMNYENTIRKLMFKFDPEKAHTIAGFGMNCIEAVPCIFKRVRKHYFVNSSMLHQNILGMDFYNIVGLGAGFDKNATLARSLFTFGFGHLELGTVTPKPQVGNPKPRLIRYEKEKSLQNFMGFNNDGCEKIYKRVKDLTPFNIPLGINIGKNKDTSEESAINDYEILLEKFNDVASYFAINISSPNTPGLRNLQNEDFIKNIFIKAKKITNKPVLLKISPDLSEEDANLICEVALEYGADGIIATNTTTHYDVLPQVDKNPLGRSGGLSGEVLKEKSHEFFCKLGRKFCNRTTLIAVGGIDSAEEAYKRIRAGASLVQIYTSFIYQGPKILRDINLGVIELMKKDGFNHISEAVGADYK